MSFQQFPGQVPFPGAENMPVAGTGYPAHYPNPSDPINQGVSTQQLLQQEAYGMPNQFPQQALPPQGYGVPMVQGQPDNMGYYPAQPNPSFQQPMAVPQQPQFQPQSFPQAQPSFNQPFPGAPVVSVNPEDEAPEGKKSVTELRKIIPLINDLAGLQIYLTDPRKSVVELAQKQLEKIQGAGVQTQLPVQASGVKIPECPPGAPGFVDLTISIPINQLKTILNYIS